MAVWFENIPRYFGQSFRLLRWHRHSSELTLLTPNPLSTIHGAGSRWHSHPELEFTIVTSGKGVRYVGDHVGPFAAPDCVLLGSGLPHCWVEKGEYSGYVLQFFFPPEHGIWRLGCENELYALFGASRLGLNFGKSAATEALTLLKRLGRAEPLARTGLLLELFSLLHGVLQRGQATPLSRSECGVSPGSTISPKLEGVVQWMLEQFHEPIALDDALSRAGMSPATFARQFKRHTGKTFVEFLNDARLTHAHQQLISTSRSVAEIAFEAGFNSLSHFGASFRARYGTTPRQCRDRAKNGACPHQLRQ
jgi:AraC-like DNA-binding protein